MLTRRRLILVVLVLAVVLALAVALGFYVVGERSCPPPDWVFWRSGNFGCVA